ncbi:metallothionein [Pseudomonas fluorescens]|uniref:metallothionein n=1 Tax=Pseudomonas fluorescens TaxID=294 RepID=UPI001BEA15DA|nr:metallothionein [Pseudomonas fluorescens]MBT2374700.1 metallothionein [Pseudomonas fluorescens]
MQQQTCACPHCNCLVGNNAVMKDGKRYCCQGCADHHAHGEPCASSTGCECAKSAHG